MTKSTIPATDKPFVQVSRKEDVAGVRPISDQGEPGSTPWFGGVRLEEAITIGRPVSEVYSFCRQIQNYPTFCKSLKNVQMIDEINSRWTALGSNDKTLTWDSRILEERPDELISWRSEGGDFENAGSIRFRPAPAGRGTELTWTLTYNPPVGPLGSLIAKLTGKEPSVLLRDQLRRLKALLETGEIPTTVGQSAVVES